jgi:uncharacterized integral membrane protein (TIGR00698 family)
MAVATKDQPTAPAVWARSLAPGIAIAASVALAAVLLEGPLRSAATALTGRSLGLPAMVIALIIGVALNRLAARPVFTAGMAFSVRTVLRFAVALLGIRISLADIYALGPATALLVVTAMAATLASGVVFARLIGRDDPYGALAGAATAVCGASAALATSTVLPDYRDKAADVAFVVVACNAIATLAMIAYPPLCALLGFDARATGVMLGSTIHDVAQVAGAGYAVSDAVGNNAVIVKLFRVFLLLPVVIGVGWYFASARGERRGGRPPVPMFAVAFLALVVINSLGVLPAIVITTIGEVSRWGLLLAIGALGLMTSFGDIGRAGWRHLAVMFAVSALILVIATGGLMVIKL